MISTTWCPRSWNSRNFRRTTVWPRWMSGVVGSTPSFTRSGRPFPSCRSSSPSGSASTAFRVRKRATSPGESVMAPMLGCGPALRPVAVRTGAVLMPETPTPIIHPSATRADPFPRSNGVPPQANGSGPPPQKPKLKKLRLALVFGGLSVLALISTVFGMLMAVASDLPSLENRAQYESAENSVLYADNWGCKDIAKTDADCQQIAKLTGNQNRILLGENEISANVKNAVIAIEDRRFYGHKGVDYAGIARALVQDVLKRRAAQGGSTITQQFVKNALDASADRSVFQKLREAALAYHLERQWSKEKILTQYLNTVYFGNGAYGIEAAVRTYFGDGDPPSERAGAVDSGVSYTPPVTEEEQDPNAREAIDVAPQEAALLAGMIASPSLYDPIAHPKGATARRNLVLQRMLDMKAITQAQYDEAVRQSLPAEDDVDPPNTESEEPYFTSWMTEHLLSL